MASLPTSLYHRRLGPRQVRLCHLDNADQPSDPLQIHLEIVDFDSAPEFDALSYVWGGYDTSATVLLGSTPRRVTDNLAEALRLLRNLKITDDISDISKRRPLWIDAVCINQTDPIEQTAQVTMMGEIYSRAHTVWVSIGEEKMHHSASALIDIIYRACSDFAREEGASVENIARRYPWDGLSGVDVAAIENVCQQQSVTYEAWDHLREIFLRPYFERTWCIQEVTLARNARILRLDIPFLTLGVVASWLYTYLGNGSLLPDHIKGPYGTSEPYNCWSMFVGPIGKYSFVDLLESFRSLEATDPRDKVYGLLGLLETTSSKTSILVDYANKSLADVYTDVARADIQESQTLGILSHVKEAPDVDGVPSWVPRWNTWSGPAAINDKGGRWKACGPWEVVAQETLEQGSKTLRVRGVIFDTAVTVFQPIRFYMDDTVQDYRAVIDLWHEAAKGDQDVTAVSITNLALTLAGGLDFSSRVVQSMEHDDLIQFFSDFYAFFQTSLSQSGEGDEERRHIYQQLEFDSEGEGDAERYLRAVSFACDSRRVFRLKLGSFGLGPQHMKEGDVIVVLYGGDVPYVLRPNGDDWLFLGECWVQDIMNGELFDYSHGLEPLDEKIFRIL